MSGLDQILRHRSAHVPEADKGYPRHVERSSEASFCVSMSMTSMRMLARRLQRQHQIAAEQHQFD
ncbi:MAG: hypothetical protein AB7V13_27155, partial [Pseudorhodoplanes sp.]